MLGGIQEFPLFRRQFAIQHQLDHAQHAIHGRTDLMAHVGQELAFGAAGHLGLILGVL